ncbi:MAG: MFS transporter [Chitinophagaceae bacterium]|nr:MFS transporter [Chitinophagaceae bacterium]
MDETGYERVRKARTATSLIFLLCGIGVASWAPMVPLAKHRLNINEADLGLILLSLGGGAILTMPLAGLLITKIGNKLVILTAALVIAVILPFLTIINSGIGLGTALFVFGAGAGALDIAMNAHAVVVQQKIGRPIMSSFHAMFSVGGLIGSIGLGLLMLPGLSPAVAAVIISVLLVIIGSTQFRYLLPLETSEGGDHSFRFPKGPVILLGAFCFIFFLSEGAMLDWSGLFLKEYRGFGPAMAGAGYAVFSVAMAIMRFSGDGLVHRYGPKTVVLYGACFAALGVLIATIIPGPVATLGGFMMIGFGAANIVPVLFSAAGNVPGYAPGIALAAVTTLGYAGQLAGPALIGFVAYFVKLPVALGLLAIPMLASGIVFKRTQR